MYHTGGMFTNQNTKQVNKVKSFGYTHSLSNIPVRERSQPHMNAHPSSAAVDRVCRGVKCAEQTGPPLL